MKARHRERLALAASVVLATGVFEGWPELDTTLSALFYGQSGFVGETLAPIRGLYRAVPWMGALLFVVTLAQCGRALQSASASRDGLPRRQWRRATAFVLAMLLGVGLVVHVALKDSWGRPRPDQTQAFGGAMPFVPALHPTALCDRNCSFVSGHAAAGFSLLAFGVFGTRRTRQRWWWAAMLAGGLIGLGRVSQGRHFASDIVFCALVMWLMAVLLREVWLRTKAWRRPRHGGQAGGPGASVTQLS